MPFVKTAYLSNQESSRTSSGEGIVHFGAVRMRLNGAGQLKLRMNSLDDIHQSDLVDVSMFSATNIQPTRLCNFNEQRAALTIYTSDINEYFKINRIILFVKDIWTSYPGNT